MARIEVVSEPLCTYCYRRASSTTCVRCKRHLCPDCYEGLQCRRRKCWPRPDGEAVR